MTVQIIDNTVLPDHDVTHTQTRRHYGSISSASEIIASDIIGAVQKTDIADIILDVVIDPTGLNRILKVTYRQTL